VLVRKGFRFRLYPDREQVAALIRWESTLRCLWNLANEQRLIGLSRPHDERKYISAFDQINELTELRAAFPWIAEVPRNVCAQLLVELDKAWQRCFKKLADQPRWKRKGRDRLGVCERPSPRSSARPRGEPTVVSKATGDTLAATIMIKHFKDGTAQLWTHDGKRPLGKRTTLAKAQAREAAIKARQAAEGKKG